MTILYMSDFDRYPNAIVDLESKNRSWVEFGSKLKAMGIKNWGFHLTLLDKTLQGVDPYDPNLDSMTILRIQVESHKNWWYFLREIMRVPSPAGGKPGYLLANRGNIAMFWSLFNHFSIFAQQLRQTGKSLNARATVLGFHTCWARGTEHILFTKSDLRPDEIKDYKEIKKTLPEYLYAPHAKDKDNQQEFTTLCHGNWTYTYIPQGDEIAANKVGRGKSPTLITGDEVPFLSYVHVSMPALLAASGNSFDEAARLKAFHGILLTSTAGDLSTPEGRYTYEEFKAKGMFFSEILYDCLNRPDAIEMIFANSNCRPVPRITIAFNHLQLGYTDDWLKYKIANATGSKDQVKRDFLGIWTFGSQQNPIPEHLIATMRANSNEKPFVKRYGPYAVRFHKPIDIMRSKTIVMGLDTSELINRDSTTSIGICVETLETLIGFSISEANLSDFGRFLAHFLADFPNVTLVPEAKSSFAGIRDQLLIELPKLGVDPGRRIYSTIVDNARGGDSDQKEYKEYSHGHPSERKYYPYRQEFGFKTGPESRRVLMRDVMLVVVSEIPTLVRDVPLIDELSTLVERKGRIDHALSGHDDHVISWALANWLLRFGRNLEHYGIEPRLVMSRVKEVTVTDPKAIREDNKRRRLLQEIHHLNDKLANSKSQIEIAYYESRLKVLTSQVKESDVETVNSLDGSSKRTMEDRKRSSGYIRPIFARGR